MDKQDQEPQFDSYYDRAEYELTVSIRDLIETVARMDIVQRPGTDLYPMPMHCLYEISGIISQAIFKHSRVRPKQTNVRTLYPGCLVKEKIMPSRAKTNIICRSRPASRNSLPRTSSGEIP
jgi:hypothetical protein